MTAAAKRTFASRPQKPGYDGGTAQPAHDTMASYLKTHKAMPRMAGYPTLYPEELQIFGVVMAFIHKTRGMD